MSSAKKIAVVLSGCGFQDGSAITEAVSSLIALGLSGADYQCFAPNREAPSKNHRDGSEMGARNIMTESARIARGSISPLTDLAPESFDALLLPGGFGVALHLCNWATAGAKGSVDKTVASHVKAFYHSQKPIGAICIAPALLALVLGSEQISLTIGNDKETAAEIEKTGATHEECMVNDFITDREHRIVSTPAYMYGQAQPHQVFAGISGLVRELVEMA